MKIFRVTSLLEGLSYIAILSVSLGFISRELVFALGITHGILFMAYMALSLQVSHKQQWSIVTWLLVFFAAIIPFAFIPVEIFLRKEQEKADSEQTPSAGLADGSVAS